MKQSFINSLVALPVKDAERACAKLGIETRIQPYGTASIMLAFKNTITLWLNKGDRTVQIATAGDPTEIEK